MVPSTRISELDPTLVSNESRSLPCSLSALINTHQVQTKIPHLLHQVNPQPNGPDKHTERHNLHHGMRPEGESAGKNTNKNGTTGEEHDHGDGTQDAVNHPHPRRLVKVEAGSSKAGEPRAGVWVGPSGTKSRTGTRARRRRSGRAGRRPGCGAEGAPTESPEPLGPGRRRGSYPRLASRSRHGSR